MSQQDTITIFCCGTNFTRNNVNEAVAHTYALTQGRKWINDGPGSRDQTIIRSEDIMKKVGAGKNPGVKKMPFDHAGSKNPKAFYTYKKEINKGSTKGQGTADNIINTLQWLWLEYGSTQIDPTKAGRPRQPLFKRINLVGWSRGAVTCIMLAHAIQEAGFKTKIPDLKVNIFAFDPVPGYLNDFKAKGKFEKTGRVGEADKLPSIVNNYASIVMENITGWTVSYILSKDKAFQCVCPRFATNEARGGDVTMYPLFGEHGDCVMFNRADNPAGKIGLHLCHQFLRLNGTELQSYTLQSKDIIECYSALRLKYFDPKQKNKKEQPSKFRGRLVMNTKRTDSYFVNAHHYETFQTSLSRTLAQMQQGNIANTALLKATYPKTLDALTQLGYV